MGKVLLLSQKQGRWARLRRESVKAWLSVQILGGRARKFGEIQWNELRGSLRRGT